MGLAEKKAINNITENYLPRYQTRISENGLTIALKPDWTTFPQEGTDAIEQSQYLLSDITNQFCDMAQDKVAKDELAKRVTGFALHHDEKMTDEYAYRMELKGSEFVFTANMKIFTIGGSKQKGLKAAMEELL